VTDQAPPRNSRRRFMLGGGLLAGAWLATSAFSQEESFVAEAREGAASEEGGVSMATRKITVERISVTSTKSFPEVVANVEGRIGHPDMNTFRSEITKAKSFHEVQNVVNKAVGPSGFMEFARFDLGEIVRKERGGKAPQVVRLVIGNPLIMKQMVEQVPDAGSYAPVTVLVHEQGDGVHLSYDTMASFLAPYGNAEALKVARELDAKVEALLSAAANG